jgi:hypothetical protein
VADGTETTGGRYARGLRAAVSASAAPYGYTLTIWGSGAVLAATTGTPGVADALGFIAAAVVAFVALGTLAFGGVARRRAPSPSPFSRWQWMDAPAIVLPVLLAAGIGEWVEGVAAWPIGGAAVTVAYMSIAGGQLALAERSYGTAEEEGS